MALVKRILKGYRSIFSKIASFFALLALCVVVGFIVAWPAWELAKLSPRVFTALFLAVAVVVLVFFLYKYVRASLRINKTLFLLKTASRLILLAGIVAFVAQTYSRNIPIAFICLAAAALASGFVRFGLFDAGKAKDSGIKDALS